MKYPDPIEIDYHCERCERRHAIEVTLPVPAKGAFGRVEDSEPPEPGNLSEESCSGCGKEFDHEILYRLAESGE